ncbi:MAG: hypothetical protein ACKO5A_02210 [Actinomycetota bacterium]
MISDVYTGDDVLHWLGTPEATRYARTQVARYRFPSSVAVADDVLQAARANVWTRMQSGSLVVDNPAAYGTTVVRQAANRIARGQLPTDDLPPDDDLGDDRNQVPGASSGDPTATEVVDGDPPSALDELDDLRVVVESTPVRHPWVTSAMLSLVILRAYPDIRLDGVPAPRAGARPDQALLWPALWFAGQRLHFPEDWDDTQTRNRKSQARSRMQREVSSSYETAVMRFRDERGSDRG